MNRSERRQGAVPVGRAEEQARAQRRRTILYAVLIGLAVGAIVAVGIISNRLVPKTASDAPTFAKLSVEQQAPEFVVSTTAGPFDLNVARGKPTLLEIFATWCPHCQREAAVMNGLSATYKGKANVLGVSGSPYAIDSTSPESQADVMAFAGAFKVEYPIAYDGELDVAKKYLQGGFPTMVLIGANGKVLSIGSGEIPAADLNKAIANALAGKPVSPNFGAKT
ncbi:MAG: redoxin family protein [Candidatus Eremiobacteraeota bacterium]|nr:redoxin family protein [Candidatus Eremiobacteraeota bacterium]